MLITKQFLKKSPVTGPLCLTTDSTFTKTTSEEWRGPYSYFRPHAVMVSDDVKNGGQGEGKTGAWFRTDCHGNYLTNV